MFITSGLTSLNKIRPDIVDPGGSEIAERSKPFQMYCASSSVCVCVLKFTFLLQTEDEGNHGNDDTRCFILSTLASQGRSRVHCVLCEEQLLVFDRYPLVDGTFFLSPRQHAKSCIEVSFLIYEIIYYDCLSLIEHV